MWCIPEVTPAFYQAMGDVLTQYEKPYNPEEPVVCVDEKSVQLLAEKRAPRPMRPGKPFRRDNEYIRRGTTNIFCAVEPKAGRHLTSVRPHRKARDFAGFLAWLSSRYPDAKTIHVVMDNLNTHREASLIKRFGEHRGREIWQRFTPHYTPVHASWLNQAEIVAPATVCNGCATPSRSASMEHARQPRPGANPLELFTLQSSESLRRN